MIKLMNKNYFERKPWFLAIIGLGFVGLGWVMVVFSRNRKDPDQMINEMPTNQPNDVLIDDVSISKSGQNNSNPLIPMDYDESRFILDDLSVVYVIQNTDEQVLEHVELSFLKSPLVYKECKLAKVVDVSEKEYTLHLDGEHKYLPTYLVNICKWIIVQKYWITGIEIKLAVLYSSLADLLKYTNARVVTLVECRIGLEALVALGGCSLLDTLIIANNCKFIDMDVNGAGHDTGLSVVSPGPKSSWKVSVSYPATLIIANQKEGLVATLLQTVRFANLRSLELKNTMLTDLSVLGYVDATGVQELYIVNELNLAKVSLAGIAKWTNLHTLVICKNQIGYQIELSELGYEALKKLRTLQIEHYLYAKLISHRLIKFNSENEITILVEHPPKTLYGEVRTIKCFFDPATAYIEVYIPLEGLDLVLMTEMRYPFALLKPKTLFIDCMTKNAIVLPKHDLVWKGLSESYKDASSLKTLIINSVQQTGPINTPTNTYFADMKYFTQVTQFLWEFIQLPNTKLLIALRRANPTQTPAATLFVQTPLERRFFPFLTPTLKQILS
ncbi:hypothetical protein NEHOM01_0305 [Nematocida homosporus]|uniref:uncharacterized protein n=1 Tax=Nematocida homosporus TaxID=1912981 RepID=UPI00221F8515|nr:uncharacterized protein NEHOM01_0305 [Nematocida homosporus]KAI5184630.1 hypothetical protein NEHOM01_0305 [Nematocida homosporus]